MVIRFSVAGLCRQQILFVKISLNPFFSPFECQQKNWTNDQKDNEVTFWKAETEHSPFGPKKNLILLFVLRFFVFLFQFSFFYLLFFSVLSRLI